MRKCSKIQKLRQYLLSRQKKNDTKTISLDRPPTKKAKAKTIRGKNQSILKSSQPVPPLVLSLPKELAILNTTCPVVFDSPYQRPWVGMPKIDLDLRIPVGVICPLVNAKFTIEPAILPVKMLTLLRKTRVLAFTLNTAFQEKVLIYLLKPGHLTIPSSDLLPLPLLPNIYTQRQMLIERSAKDILPCASRHFTPTYVAATWLHHTSDSSRVHTVCDPEDNGEPLLDFILDSEMVSRTPVPKCALMIKTDWKTFLTVFLWTPTGVNAIYQVPFETVAYWWI
jgi:hypothetical protein